jgi:uncharacterized RDD family membrane protein YckC
MDKKITFSQRIVSMGIDFLSLCAIGIPLNIIAFFLQGKNQMYWMFFEITVLFTLWLCKDLIGGQSLGKHVVGHVVCSIDNINNIWRFIARNILAFIWLIEILFCLTNPSRRLGDLLFGTKIVRVKGDKSNLIIFQKKDIVVSFIITFFAVLIVMLIIWYLIQALNSPMVKLLYP